VIEGWSSSVISRLKQWYAVSAVLLLSGMHITASALLGCSLVTAAVIRFNRAGFLSF